LILNRTYNFEVRDSRRIRWFRTSDLAVEVLEFEALGTPLLQLPVGDKFFTNLSGTIKL
jgi:hypothetical protein